MRVVGAATMLRYRAVDAAEFYQDVALEPEYLGSDV